ncbi:MAG: FkbM family methyltransferase [Pirellulales bacterium]
MSLYSALRRFAKSTVRRVPAPMARWAIRQGLAILPRQESLFLGLACQFPSREPQPVVTRAGFRMRLHLDDSIERRIFYTGRYERATEAIMRRVLTGQECFVDVGANSGYFSLLAAKLLAHRGKVYAFEPFPLTRTRLEENIRENGQDDRIVVFPVALAAARESRTLFTCSGNLGMTSFSTSDRSHAPAGEEVQCDALDAVWDEIGNPRVDLLKMDVEGAEWLIFPGMRRVLAEQLCRHLLIEIHPRQIRELGGQPRAILDALVEAGYRLWGPSAGRLQPLDAEQFLSSDRGHRFIMATLDDALAGMDVPEGF